MKLDLHDVANIQVETREHSHSDGSQFFVKEITITTGLDEILILTLYSDTKKCLDIQEE